MTENIKSEFPDIRQSIGIALILIVSMIVFFPIDHLLKNYFDKEQLFFFNYSLSSGISFLIFHLIRKNKTNQSSYNINKKHVQIIPIIIVLNIALLLGISSPIMSLIPFPDFMKDILKELGKQNGVFSFLTIVIIGPVLEEFIFRGIVLDGFLKKYTPTKAIVVSSILFGIIHLNPWQFIGAAFFGLFAGWIYYKTQNLFLTIILHITNNLFSFVQGFFLSEEQVMEMNLIDFYGGIMNTILVTGGCITVFLVGVFYLNNYFKKRNIISEIPVISSES